jgi:arachidonate 15-lipoxygenase
MCQVVRRRYTGDEARGVTPWTFDEWSLPLDIEQRGVGAIPNYPYRDDGLLIWQAIEAFVKDYLELYYRSDLDVVNDSELQAWAADLTHPEGGRLKGFPASFSRRDALRDTLTRILWASGPMHSAVNFAQYSYMAYTPNMPLALYSQVPGNLRQLSQTEQAALVLKLLPPAQQAFNQLSTIVVLTSFHFDKLGVYEPGDVADPAALPLVKALEGRLQAVGQQIAQRNTATAGRVLPYEHLHPDNIMNSTSI